VNPAARTQVCVDIFLFATPLSKGGARFGCVRTGDALVGLQPVGSARVGEKPVGQVPQGAG